MGYRLVNINSNFTRPNDTTAYAANDLVANSTLAASVTPLSWQVGANFKLYSVSIVLNSTVPTNSTYKLHLYGATPTGVANGDNGAWQTNMNSYVDSISIDASVSSFVNGTTATAHGLSYPLPLPFTTVFGLLMATAAYTPVAQETFNVNLQGEVSW